MMAPAEGVYFLANAATNDKLVLSEGDWHFGDVKAQPQESKDAAFFPWLVTQPPGAQPDVHVLLNVQSGTFAGVWRDEWLGKNHHVKCTPSHLSAANIRWKIPPAPEHPDAIVFEWLGDPARVLSQRPDSDGTAAKPLNDAEIEMNRKQWRLNPYEPALEQHRDWMRRLPDDIRLHELNLPSTHQSLANHGISHVRPDLNWNRLGDDQKRPWAKLPVFIDNPRCQEASIWDQLQLGIRVFDLRLDLDRQVTLESKDDGSLQDGVRYYLYARHGLAEMGYSWSAVLLVLRAFLRANPSECVIVNARYEKSTPGSVDRTRDWNDAFVDETAAFWNQPDNFIYKWWENGYRVMNDISLHEVRGKVILVTEGDYMPQDERDGRNRGARFFPHDMCAVGKYDSTRNQWDTQLRDCENNLNAAKGEQNPQRYFQTSFNVSGLPAPLKASLTAQSLFKNPLNITEALRTAKEARSNEVFDPIDFFTYFESTWSGRGDDCPLSEQRLGKNGAHRVGKIDVDFCNRMQQWIGNIVRSNRTAPGQEF